MNRIEVIEGEVCFPKAYSEKWLKSFNRQATDFANEMSKDTTKVGALLIGPNRETLLTTFNGPPMGVKDTPDKFERPAKYYYASHAEKNLIDFAARYGIKTDGLTVYCTHNPCSTCIRSLIQAGIKHVMYNTANSFVSDTEMDRNAVRLMCEEAGVFLEGIDHETL